MLLEMVVSTSSAVSGTSKRNEKVVRIAECLRHLQADELKIGVAFLSGEIRQRRLGVSYATVFSLGDIDPAGEPRLSVGEVDETLTRISEDSGQGSTGRKRDTLGQLLAKATAMEQDFLKRLLVGELRQGALESLVVDALAKAADLPAAEVRRARMLESDLGAVAEAAMREGVAGLARFQISLFKPIQPMLANTAEDVADALSRLNKAQLDYKLDGARVQVHKSGDTVRVYSRRLNEVTEAVPEVVEEVLALPARNLILDGETLAMRSNGKPHPFQVTMRRFGRRLDVDTMRAELPLTTCYFDCLLLDDQSLIDESTASRGEALATTTPTAVVPRLVTDSESEASAFLRSALDVGHEGIMAKAVDAAYQAGSRGADWLKIKHTHTLDLVVLAAEWGSGRRKGWLSNLHLGARDQASGSFVMLGKTFKGLTDKTLKWQTQRLLELEVERQGPVVYVRPELVVEIAFNDVQTSPHYPGGLALRFARVKNYRVDKSAADADTIDAVRNLHAAGLG